MTNFNQSYKSEVIQSQHNTIGEHKAFLSAVIHTAGSIHISRSGVNIEVATDNSELVAKFLESSKAVFDLAPEVNIKNQTRDSKAFLLSFPSNLTRTIADNLGIIEYMGDTPISLASGVEIPLETREEMIAYIRGLVIAIGSLTVPQLVDESMNEYSGGYHFELDFLSEKMSYNVMELLAQLDIFAKKSTRGESLLVYIKDSDVICDLLVLCGATDHALELYNIMAKRSVRENVNRQQNCQIANIDKAVEAGQRQAAAIEKIAKVIGLNALPPKLKEMAEFRLANPDYTLEDIVTELGNGISKSGVNHRLRKLMDIAATCDEADKKETKE